MIDRAQITIKAGNGGRGIASFLREKYNPKGGPDGGDGGQGGDVYIEATDSLSTLLDFQYQRLFEAENGKPGGSKNMHGRNGQDLILKVPTGSVVYVNRIESEEEAPFFEKNAPVKPKQYRQKVINYHRIAKENYYQERSKSDQGAVDEINMREKNEVQEQDSSALPKSLESYLPTYDLSEDGEKVLIAKGGKGGRGNNHFKSSSHQVPMESERGQKGELVEIIVVLKTIANIGIIGLPNAGKSTLLASLTSATPKIGNYPFTTIDPNLGVLKEHTKSVILADLPGLIQGAHQGRGLGIRFLQHIERTSLLLHVVAIPAEHLEDSSDNLAKKIYQNYLDIRSELILYRKGLEHKKEVVVINKIDLLSPEKRQEVVAEIDKLFSQHALQPIYISATDHQGVAGLRKIILNLF